MCAVEKGAKLRGLLAGTLAGALVAAGCGELTSGGVGDLEVVVVADSVPAVAPRTAAYPVAGAPSSGQDGIEGTLILRVQIFALSPPSTWIQVTDGAEEVVLDLAGGPPTVLAQKELPEGQYKAIRTIFWEVSAEVTHGLEVDGDSVTGTVRVDLGPGDRLAVLSPIDLEIAAATRTTISVDLHAHRWLRRLDRIEQRVRSEDFAEELRVRPKP